MTDDEDDSTDEPSNLLYDPFNLMPARENLQEFPGRVPTRKRKKESENPERDSDKPKVREILQLDLLNGKETRITITPSRNELRDKGRKNFHISHPKPHFP